MRLKKRHVLLILLVPVLGLVAFLGIRSFIFFKIEKRITQKIESLKSDDIQIHYKDLSFNWRRNLIEIRNFSLEKTRADTACSYPDFISVERIRGEGFRMLPLLFNNVLSFEAIYVDEPQIAIRSGEPLIRDTSSGEKAGKDVTLLIDHTYFTAVNFIYRDSAMCDTSATVKSNVTIDGMTIDFLTDSPVAWQADWLRMDRTEITQPGKQYTFRMARLRMDFLNACLRIDSIEVMPLLGKRAFGQARGFEVDRFEGLIPFLECRPFALSFLDSTRVTAGAVEVQFYLKIFRDKNLPFRKQMKLLPVDQLAALPFVLTVDSLKIRKSYVEYEEYPEGAANSGKVYFDNLYASAYHINNRSSTGAIDLAARADLQGKGRIDLRVVMPFEAGRRATAEGSLTNFDIPEINSMLVPSSNIKIESGNMEKLSFDFKFDRIRSDGSLELQYKDLKLVVFKEEENQDGDADKDNLKTFMMNTFIFRTNMDEDVPEEERSGTIGYVRDNTRSIFNFWIKSILSGIKSAYNLDKMEAKKTEKEIRKEERLTKREARKQRRAARKRERG